jgi:hypothetical protein
VSIFCPTFSSFQESFLFFCSWFSFFSINWLCDTVRCRQVRSSLHAGVP